MRRLSRCAVLSVLAAPALFVACGTSNDDSGSNAPDGATRVDATAPPATSGDADDGTDGNVMTNTDATANADGGGGGGGGGGDDDSDATIDASALDADAARALSRPFMLTGIIGTGQSLSVGARGTPLLTTTQPYNNVRLYDDGSVPRYDNDGDVLSLGPLVAQIRPATDTGKNNTGASKYPYNISGETPHESLANQMTALSMAADGVDYRVAMSVVGESGQPMTVIEKNGTGKAYAASMYEANATKALADAGHMSFGYGAVFLTHGESDYATTTYEADVLRLAQNYDTDLRAITGQTQSIPLFLSQQGVYPPAADAQAISTQAEWRVSVDNPGAVICVGPKYQYEYSLADHLHLIPGGYIALGEKYAEAYFQTVVRGQLWHPVQPLNVARAGATITVHMDVAFPPLAFDPLSWPWAFDPTPQMGGDHVGRHTAWKEGKGFEVTDSTGELTITSATINGSDVVLTLAAAPTGTNLTVAYAMTQDGAPNVDAGVTGDSGGLSVGRHGAVRDSDPFQGRDAETIAVTVTQGSTAITPVAAGGFAQRTVHDVVSGAGASLPANTAVATRLTADPTNHMTLTSAWTGASGTAMLHFAHEQRNYLVQFSFPVP